MHLQIKHNKLIAFFLFIAGLTGLIVTPSSSVYPLSFPFQDFFTQNISKCSKLEWVKEDGRTQGDGWIWFPGRGSDENLEIAYLKAEGMAIGRLLQECITPHKEVKIHERCDEKIGRFYRTYVRVSLRDIQCRESKYADKKKEKFIINQSLMKTYSRYKKLIGITPEMDSDKTECSSDNAQKCHHLGKYEFQIGNIQKALEHFDVACKAMDYKSCFNAGTSAWSLNFNKRALGYFQLSCEQNDPHACLFVAYLHNAADSPNSELTKKYLIESCSLKLAEGCLRLGQFFEYNKNNVMALKHYKLACSMNFAEGCHQTARIYFDKNLFKKAKGFAQSGCNLGHKKSCYNYGFIQEKVNNLKAALKYYEMACNMGLSLGCLDSGRQVSKTNRQRSLAFFEQGCELANKESCKEAATIYYDNQDIISSLKYSKLACKLGELKSCHNSGYLELNRGNKREGTVFLKSSCSQGLKESCKLLGGKEH